MKKCKWLKPPPPPPITYPSHTEKQTIQGRNQDLSVGVGVILCFHQVVMLTSMLCFTWKKKKKLTKVWGGGGRGGKEGVTGTSGSPQVVPLQEHDNIIFGTLHLSHIFCVYLSTSDTNLVRKLFLVLNLSLACPLNSSFLSAKSMQTIRQSSPRYIPEIIFSNLMGNLNKENSLQAIENIFRESYDYAMQSYFKKPQL